MNLKLFNTFIAYNTSMSNMKKFSITELINTPLDKRSKEIRIEAINLSKANGGYHYGGSFSCAEILITLYDEILNDNDRFILSKGHACWVYYVLLQEKGYSPLLEGHPHLDLNNGVHWTTGSEGHGLPAGLGMAFAKKFSKKKDRVYILMGDGECQEGTTWESLLQGGHRNLNNVTAIVDYNGIQGSGYVSEILPVEALKGTAELCGWDVIEINGHDNKQIKKALLTTGDKPVMIIAYTIKGKGVSYMENDPEWHAQWPDEEKEKIAREELAK
jgi:transketolase